MDQTEYRPQQFAYNYDQQYNDIYNQYSYDHNENYGNGYNMEFQSLFGHPPTSEPSNNNSQSIYAIREGLTYTEL